mmetsp:Transcript_15373/g.47901  ORF Transcript_15373/g.47901 Transcript_15373/m.47901 type:complete len:497 (+) Transcript_15373:66-1556(+)
MAVMTVQGSRRGLHGHHGHARGARRRMFCLLDTRADAHVPIALTRPHRADDLQREREGWLVRLPSLLGDAKGEFRTRRLLRPLVERRDVVARARLESARADRHPPVDLHTVRRSRLSGELLAGIVVELTVGEALIAGGWLLVAKPRRARAVRGGLSRERLRLAAAEENAVEALCTHRYRERAFVRRADGAHTYKVRSRAANERVHGLREARDVVATHALRMARAYRLALEAGRGWLEHSAQRVGIERLRERAQDDNIARGVCSHRGSRWRAPIRLLPRLVHAHAERGTHEWREPRGRADGQLARAHALHHVALQIAHVGKRRKLRERVEEHGRIGRCPAPPCLARAPAEERGERAHARRLERHVAVHAVARRRPFRKERREVEEVRESAPVRVQREQRHPRHARAIGQLHGCELTVHVRLVHAGERVKRGLKLRTRTHEHNAVRDAEAAGAHHCACGGRRKREVVRSRWADPQLLDRAGCGVLRRCLVPRPLTQFS